MLRYSFQHLISYFLQEPEKGDCNGDGKVDCIDFAYMHRLGGYSCKDPSMINTTFYQRFHSCWQVVQAALPKNLSWAAFCYFLLRRFEVFSFCVTSWSSVQFNFNLMQFCITLHFMLIIHPHELTSSLFSHSNYHSHIYFLFPQKHICFLSFCYYECSHDYSQSICNVTLNFFVTFIHICL